ncbi:EamA family transporter [Megasphaera vaginalis (ex Bordigoni et al. 2020)]|uniref:EamA family transporter n=1 Tax=Megasphaera vaginalis (ex Bordigoni et al. 2020) TaxID=2045301 RepID=UPI000C7E31CE|nr:EamA family transporter [Megasphaera vaginalis (ex Bordigoni et al. 2020)]
MTALLFAFASAVFAALTAILAKIGMDGVDSTTATAVRTVVVLVMSWAMVFIAGHGSSLQSFTSRNWWFLLLSGLATGASWLCYFKALQTGSVAQIVAIDKCSIVFTVLLAAVLLGEGISLKTAAGTALIVLGTFVMIL